MKSRIEMLKDCLNVKITDDREERTYAFKVGESVIEEDGVYILQKSAIMELVEGEKIVVSPPKVVFAQNGCFVLCRSAEYNGRTEYALGEANSGNLTTEIAKKYPAITADNRAYERAVLAVLGLSGRVYGSDEIAATPNMPPVSAERNIVQTKTVSNTTSNQTAAPASNSNVANQPATSAKAAKFAITDEMKAQYPWLENPEFDKYGDETNPSVYAIKQGRNKEKGWNATEMLIHDRSSTEWYASKQFSNSNVDFNKCVVACRKAIYNELYKKAN